MNPSANNEKTGPSSQVKPSTHMIEDVGAIHTTMPSRIPTTGYMTFFSIVIAVSGFMNGFDTAYAGTLLQMQPFINSFGHCHVAKGHQVCLLSAKQQSITSISFLFNGVGTALTVFSSNWLGRRAALQVGCLLVIIGTAGQLGTAGNYLNYMVCKCIAAIGLGHFSVAALTYGVECTSPQKRGMLLALYGVGLSTGTTVVGAVCLGASTIPNNWAWKTPIIVQIPMAAIYSVLIQTFPESPRWLMTKERQEEARKSFARFYNMDPSAELITAQVTDTQAGIDFEKAISSTASWTEIFHRSYIRRQLVSTLAAVASTFSGIWLVAPYAAIFLSGLGIKNPFLINVAFSSCTLGGALIGPFLVEYLGRRMSMLVGYASLGCCMLIFSAVSTGLGPTNKTSKDVLVAFLCIWDFFFGAFLASSTLLASVEMHSVRLRTWGQPFASTIAQITAFAAAFWTPYMLNPQYGNMGTNVGYFYFGLNVVTWVLIFIFLPETARLTLEQVDDLFASKVPAWKTSIKRNKLIAKGEDADLSTEQRGAVMAHMNMKGET